MNHVLMILTVGIILVIISAYGSNVLARKFSKYAGTINWVFGWGFGCIYGLLVSSL